MHRFLLHNDDVVDAHQNTLSAGQVGLLNGWGVFTTMRVAEGVLFAFERHWVRMQRDAAKLHVPFPSDPTWLKTRLLRLVEANSAWNATLRVAIVRNRGGLFEGPDLTRDFDLIAFTADRNDWGSSVRLAVKPHGRYAQSEFAGTKIDIDTANRAGQTTDDRELTGRNDFTRRIKVPFLDFEELIVDEQLTFGLS